MIICIGNISMALQFFDKAIDQAEENKSYYFQARGLAHGMNSQLENAINDFSLAHEINPQSIEILIQRMKYFQSLGQHDQALKDLQNVVKLNSNHPQVHFLTGELLQNQGAVLEASLCYSNDANMEFDEQLLVNRYKCNIHMRQLDLALRDVQNLFRLTSKKEYSYDLVCLNIYKKISINQYSDDLINECEKMICQIQDSSEGIVFNQQSTNYILGVIYVHQQKYQQAIDIFSKYESKHQNLKDTLQYSQSFQDITNKQVQVETSDKSLLRSVSSFEELVLKSRQESSSSSIICQDQAQAQNYFNLCLTYYKLKNYQKSWDCFQKMRQNMDPNQKIKTFELENLIHSNLNNLQIQEECDIDIIFNVTGKICQILPQIQIENQIKASLVFDLPLVKLNTYNFDFDYSIIDQLQIILIESRAEAPWIKRCINNIKFTHDIIHFDELNLYDEQYIEQNSQQQQQNNLNFSYEINHGSSIQLSYN